ncbi:hypothetical protein M885DRAFT_552841 [Pelagophyceae sp. CCMP2097]|nr:hypothetical protein M885DRAFT_552841 [Pelagophyceae sp. CCMP2097]
MADPASDDFYKRLGVWRSAEETAIKKAYRQLAKEYHPDKNGGNPALAAKFQKIHEAYDVLSDDKKRAAYDHFGKEGAEAVDAGMDVDVRARQTQPTPAPARRGERRSRSREREGRAGAGARRWPPRRPRLAGRRGRRRSARSLARPRPLAERLRGWVGRRPRIVAPPEVALAVRRPAALGRPPRRRRHERAAPAARASTARRAKSRAAPRPRGRRAAQASDDELRARAVSRDQRRDIPRRRPAGPAGGQPLLPGGP